MTTSKKKGASKPAEKAKRAPAAKAAARATATVEAPATPVVTTVTFATEPAPTLVAKPAPRAEDLTVVEFQQRLAERGWYVGLVDGQYGPWTRHAVQRCQEAHGLTVDGEPTPETLHALGF